MKKPKNKNLVITLVNVPPYRYSEFIDREGRVGKGDIAYDIYTAKKMAAVGPASIAGVLKSMGFDVDVIEPRLNKNGHFEDEELERIIQSDIVGFTSMTRGREITLQAASWVKEQARLRGREVTVICGGIDPTMAPEKYLERTVNGKHVVDYVVRHEGEKTIEEFMKVYIKGGSMRNILGLSYLVNGKVRHNPNRPLMTSEELSRCPLPFYPEKVRKTRLIHPVEASRGCPLNCEFCSVRKMWGGVHRRKSPKRVIEEIKLADGKLVIFVDDTFLPPNPEDRKAAKKVMRAIKNAGLKNKFAIQVDTPSAKDKEAVHLAKEMGVLVVFLAVESINKEALKAMRKSATVEQNVEAVKIWKKEGGCFVHILSIAGVCGKTVEESDTPQLVQRLGDWIINKSGAHSFQMWIETPLPGTDFAKRKSLLPKAEEDTSVMDLQHVVTDPPPSFSREGLQLKVAEIYQEGYSFKHMLGAVIRSVRPIFPLKRSFLRAAMTVSVRLLAKKVIPTMLKKDPYTADWLAYLRNLDYKDHLEKGRQRAEQSPKWENPEETEELKESKEVQLSPEFASVQE